MAWRKNSVVLLLLLLSFWGGAQDSEPAQNAAYDEPISEESWEEATDGLNYGDIDRPEPEEPEEQVQDDTYSPPSTPRRDWSIPGLGSFGTAVLFGIVIIGLAFLLVFLVNRSQGAGGRRIKEDNSGRAFSFEELEEYIHETELERYLRLALEETNYKAAVRVYYLMAIKALSEQNWITWKRDKTNFDYVREMRRRPEYSSFRKLTYLFEVVWYGDTEIDQQVYRRISPDFESFLNQIQPKK